MTPKEFYNKYKGRKYQLGKIDCFRLIFDYLAGITELPKEFEGLTLETYFELFKENPDFAHEVMIRFFQSILPEKDINKFRTGDILVLEYEKEHQIFPGIMLANTDVLVVTENDGVRIAPLAVYKIRRCFSWQQ